VATVAWIVAHGLWKFDHSFPEHPALKHTADATPLDFICYLCWPPGKDQRISLFCAKHRSLADWHQTEGDLPTPGDGSDKEKGKGPLATRQWTIYLWEVRCWGRNHMSTGRHTADIYPLTCMEPYVCSYIAAAIYQCLLHVITMLGIQDLQLLVQMSPEFICLMGTTFQWGLHHYIPSGKAVQARLLNLINARGEWHFQWWLHNNWITDYRSNF